MSSTSKPYFCLISLLNGFIFSPGENLNNNWERSFLSHLKLEEGCRKFSDKSSPNSKNSVTQTTVVRKIFTKMLRTPVWMSSCWPERESTSTVLVVFPCLFWCFYSVQYVSDATILAPRRVPARIFWRLYFDWFWLHSVLKISWEKCQAKLQVKGLPGDAFKAFITACWQWLKWELRQRRCKRKCHGWLRFRACCW